MAAIQRSRSYLITLAVVSLLLSYSVAFGKTPTKLMHVAAVSIPAYGHFMPVKGIAEQLLVRGHRVTLFVETKEWCDTEMEGNLSYRCVVMPPSGTFSRKLFLEMSLLEDTTESFKSIFDEMFRHNREQLSNYVNAFAELHKSDPVDLILMDLSTILGFSLSTKFNVPHVSVFPLTMHMVVGSSTYLPSIGTAFPRNMSIAQRFSNYALKMIVSAVSFSMLNDINAARATLDIAPLQSAGDLAGLDGLIFAPTIWGYDIPQPLCPNIVAIGAYSPSVLHQPIEPSLKSFLDGCTEGAIYVNFGTLAVVGDAMFERVRQALQEARPFCIVWKVVEDERRAQLEAVAEATGIKMFVSKRFSNPIEIMNHANTRTFLTHCGDTSVLEAVQAELPLAGIPFFADQADVCQRIEEGGIGTYVGHKHRFTVDELRSALVTLANVSTSVRFRDRIRIIHRVSKMLGGAQKAAQMIEDRMTYGLLAPENFVERCMHLSTAAGPVSVFEVQEYDFLAIHLAIALSVLYFVVSMRCCCRCSKKTRHPEPLQTPARSSPSVKVLRKHQ